MLISGTHKDVKDKILQNFTKPKASLRIDCCNVHKIIHVGPPEDVESYVQHIGRCGRDGKPSCAIMLYGKKLIINTSKSLFPVWSCY